MSHRPHPKYSSNDARNGPWTTCDECGFVWSQSSMAFQYEYRGGSTPVNTNILKCPRCIDDLNPQFKLIVIPPDPPVVYNTRPEPYALDETNWLLTESGLIITTEDGSDILTSIPDPQTAGNITRLQSALTYHLGSVSVAYLDLFNGNPVFNGSSVLAAITGSSVRTNIASQLTTVLGVAKNTATLVVTTASANQTNINYVGIYSAASGGTLLTSGPVSASPTIAMGNPVQFPALGLSINLA